MITVHITDDHRMLVEGLRSALDLSGITRVTGVSHTLAQCRAALAVELPDVLLLDLNLPDGSGVDFCAEALAMYPSLKILVLTTHSEYSVARRVIDNGAAGYILKNALTEEVIDGIETVMEGSVYLCDQIDALINRKNEPPVWLTVREQELLRLVVDGYTNQEIADKVFLSVETIKTYRKNLILKLGAKNSMVLVKMAIEKKLI